MEQVGWKPKLTTRQHRLGTLVGAWQWVLQALPASPLASLHRPASQLCPVLS